jgi:Spy/CpxP family protein refolding chaperone
MNNLSKWKICSYLAAIFLAGAVAGGFVGLKAGARMMFRPPKPEVMTERVYDELQSRLNLTPEQAKKIKPLINDSIIRFQTIVRADISTAFSNSIALISAELTPEQRVKFSELQKEHEKFLNGTPKDTPTNSSPNNL